MGATFRSGCQAWGRFPNLPQLRAGLETCPTAASRSFAPALWRTRGGRAVRARSRHGRSAGLCRLSRGHPAAAEVKCMTAAKQLEDLLGLRTAPVALTFRASPPAGVPHVAAAGPSGCSYWKRAAEGETFYTEAADHYNCPIGAYTHGIDLPPARAKELEGVLGMMFGLGYLRPEEVPAVPRRPDRFAVAVYAPLKDAPGEADVVLVRGNARQVM